MWCFNISTLPLAGARQRKEEKRRNKRPEGKSATENCVQQCACRFAEWGPESATRSLSFFNETSPKGTSRLSCSSGNSWTGDEEK